MSPIIQVAELIVVGIVLAYYLARLGAALKIPLFVKWSNRLAEKKRVQDQRCSISFDSDALTVKNLLKPDEGPFRIPWNEISQITAFKRDLFTVDLICMLIEFNDGFVIEIDEQMDGWNRLIDALPSHLHGCKKLEQWIFDVGSPAFAANPNQIYRRENRQTA